MVLEAQEDLWAHQRAGQQDAQRLIVIARRTRLLVDLLIRGFPRRFTMARATRLPSIGRIADHALFRGDDIIYLLHNRCTGRYLTEDAKVPRRGAKTPL